MSPSEQAQIVPLLIERVDYDGAQGTVAITFHPNCSLPLAQERAEPAKEKRS